MTSSENQNHETAADALAVRSQASDWLVARRMSHGWSEKDQSALDLWLAESPANLLAYWRLDAAWNQAQRLTALRRPERAPDGSSNHRNVFQMLGIVTALILVAILGVGGVVYLQQPASKTYATPVGGHLAIALTDGSKIELNTDTVLRLSDTANRRQATLEKGEAYFQIKHDRLHPFTLAVDGRRVIDLGTKFSVREQPDRVEVMLIEGSARIESESAAAPPVVLRPGDIAIATASSLSISKKPVTELGDHLAWRRGMLAFKYATLAEAAAEFNRYNSTKIVIADAHVSRLTIYGTFPAKDVTAFADAAQAYFKLRVENRGDEVVISR